MTAFMSLMTMLFGVGLAARAPHNPEHTAAVETLAGLALVAGLSMIGFGLAFIH